MVWKILRALDQPFKIFQIDEKDAKLAAKNGVVVITTLSEILTVKSTEARKMADSLFKINLQTLKRSWSKNCIGK